MREIEICTLNGTKWNLGDESPGPMTWVDAKAWCESIGQELPTRDVLLMAYLNPETRSEFAYNYYWSSTEGSSTIAWAQGFLNGPQASYGKYYAGRVRAVRAIKVEKLLAQPETEQEPVEDRIARWHKLGYEQGRKSALTEREPVAWMSREPLSEQVIAEQAVWATNSKHSFKDGVRWAEQAHGIGVNDE